ncbi:MAG TPA: hypothetical protein VIB99_10920 [Candidatus Limnocylindrales bacterium]|jgi:hypothetical protein
MSGFDRDRDPNAPADLGLDDEGVGNIRPDAPALGSDQTPVDVADANAPAELGLDDEGIGNIRPKRAPGLAPNELT